MECRNHINFLHFDSSLTNKTWRLVSWVFANEIANQVLSLHQFLFTMRAFSVDAVVDSFHMLPRETFVTPNFNTPTSKILQKKRNLWWKCLQVSTEYWCMAAVRQDIWPLWNPTILYNPRCLVAPYSCGLPGRVLKSTTFNRFWLYAKGFAGSLAYMSMFWHTLHPFFHAFYFATIKIPLFHKPITPGHNTISRQ